MTPPLPRVMIVEDGQDDAVVLTHLLGKAGVEHAAHHRTGEAALQYLREAVAGEALVPRPHVVFLDVCLPCFNGFDLLQWIRSQPGLRDVVVILLSGSDEPRNLGKAAQLGADCFLVKFPPPSAMRELMEHVARHLASPSPRGVLPISCNLLLTRVP